MYSCSVVLTWGGLPLTSVKGNLLLVKGLGQSSGYRQLEFCSCFYLFNLWKSIFSVNPSDDKKKKWMSDKQKM